MVTKLISERSIMRHLLSHTLIVGLALGSWGLAVPVVAESAPDSSLDTHSFYEDAMSRAASGDVAGAVIQLKNVLQSAPAHLPARLALGRLLLRQGQAASAEKELRTALRLGAVPGQVMPILGNALLMQRKSEDILESIKSQDPASDGSFEVLLLRGRAHYELGELEEAEELFDKASRKSPKQAQSWIGLAMVERSQGRLESSLQYVRQAIDIAPEDPEAWFQYGQTLRGLGESEAALGAYDRALEINPRLLRVRLSRAMEFLMLGNLDAAREDAQYVFDNNPQDLMAAFVLWRAHKGLGHATEANAALQTLGEGLSNITEDAIMREPYLLRLAAWFALARRDLARSERYLTQFVSLNPHDPNMQILLGRVQLLLDDPKAAISTLYPLSQRYPNNLVVLTPLGQAYFKIGNYDEASAMFEKAAKLAPNRKALKAHLALSRIGTGNWDEAVDGLNEAVESGERALRAGLLLTILQFKMGERTEALETIRGLIGERPTPRAYNLLGIMEAANGNLAGARQAFEETSKIAPAFVPAQYNLAKLEMAEGNLASATQRMEAIIESDPRSSTALLALADIALIRGDEATAVSWLEKAVSVVPDSIQAQSRRIDLYLKLERNQDALNAAVQLSDRKPENAVVLETLARVQAAIGKDDAARHNFRNAVHYANFDGPLLMGIARQQVQLGDYGEAQKTLRKANKSAMVETAAASALIRLDIRLGSYDRALNGIERLKEMEIHESLVHVLTGELFLAEKRFDEALIEFEAAHQLAPGTETILGIFSVMDASGHRDEAISRLEQWSAEHPDDIEVQRKLALWYLPTRQLDKAKVLHESLLINAPDDPVLLSNLARIYQLEGDQRARRLAEHAVSVSPEWPVALDTLGWILVTEGNVARGLEYLRESIARANNPLTRYHLAQALNEQGRTDEAKVELRRLLSSGRELEWMDDVQTMYDRLALAAEKPATH